MANSSLMNKDARWYLRMGRIIPLAIAVIVVTAIFVSVMNKVSIDAIVENGEWVAHTHDIESELFRLERYMLDAETGQRGFLYTDDETFLEPYKAATDRIPALLDKIALLLSDSTQVNRFAELRARVRTTLDYLAGTIKGHQPGHNHNKEEYQHTDISAGKNLMDAFRAQARLMREGEIALLAGRQVAADRAEKRGSIISIGGVILTAIIGVLIYFYIYKVVIRRINEVSLAVASSTAEIASSVEQQERTISEQTAAVNQTTAAMDELGASSKQVSEQADGVSSAVNNVLQQSDKGGKMVEESLVHMNDARQKVEEVGAQILRLSEQVSQIGEITAVVGEFAGQTNLLALNAAVEAARAGEQGRGFSVVAGEIRKLAEQSKQSAARIQQMVGEIQKASNSTVMVMEEAAKGVDRNVELSSETSEAFNQVSTSVNRASESLQQITLSVKQQASGVTQAMDAMNDINTGAKQTSSGISQTRVGVERLQEMATVLTSIV